MPSHRGGPPSGDDEDLSPPIGGIIVPPVSSSDDEVDNQEYVEDNCPPGYQPLNQDPQYEDQPSHIDYSSLSGLMAALNTHGPNNINDSDDSDNDSGDETGEIQGNINVRTQMSMTVDWNQLEASAQFEETDRRETAELWNTPAGVQQNSISLDSQRLEEIKAAMSTFSLPPTAIPSWAQG